MTAAEHASEADRLVAVLRSDGGSTDPARHFWVELAQAHALTALALDVTQDVRVKADA